MCPNSVLGISFPLWMTADPMPVPKVSSTTRPELSFARAVPFLGKAGRVGVVENRHVLAVQLGGDDLARVGADPGLVHVGRRLDDAVR